MLSTIESRYATQRGLINGADVSTKDSEALWFTSRIANTISDLRNIYGQNIDTKSKKTATGKRHGVYVLNIIDDRTLDLLEEFRSGVIAKYRFEPKLLRLYLGTDYDDETAKAS